MSESHLHLALRDSMREVLERMFFLSDLDALESAPPSGECDLTVYLTFEGAPSGNLSVRVNPSLARAIAADFLGIELDETSSEQVEQVLCELANMICGSVLSRVESNATFRLSSPRRITAGGGELSSPAEENCAEVSTPLLTAVIRTRKALCLAGEKSAF